MMNIEKLNQQKYKSVIFWLYRLLD